LFVSSIRAATPEVGKMESPVRLFWIHKNNDDLLAVAATSAHSASRLLRVHQRTLERDGGELNADSAHHPGKLDAVVHHALNNVEKVYRYSSGWDLCTKLNARKHRANKAKPDLKQLDDDNSHPRLLTFSHESHKHFVAAGGANWLRNEIAKASDSDAISKTRVIGEKGKRISVRMSDRLWVRLQMLGGKTWIMHRLAVTYKSRHPGQSVDSNSESK
jgi:hypothetical protein